MLSILFLYGVPLVAVILTILTTPRSGCASEMGRSRRKPKEKSDQ